jgi:hypothetical protein
VSSRITPRARARARAQRLVAAVRAVVVEARRVDAPTRAAAEPGLAALRDERTRARGAPTDARCTPRLSPASARSLARVAGQPGHQRGGGRSHSPRHGLRSHVAPIGGEPFGPEALFERRAERGGAAGAAGEVVADVERHGAAARARTARRTWPRRTPRRAAREALADVVRARRGSPSRRAPAPRAARAAAGAARMRAPASREAGVDGGRRRSRGGRRAARRRRRARRRSAPRGWGVDPRLRLRPAAGGVERACARRAPRRP